VARIPSDATQWTDYGGESDNDTHWHCSMQSNGKCNTYPFPIDAPIEGEGCGRSTACWLQQHARILWEPQQCAAACMVQHARTITPA
jgi:hypothetical protein